MARGSTTLPANPRSQKAMERKWAAESALQTLRRVEEIRRDPQLMRDARALATREMQALKKVAGSGPAKRK